MQLRVSKAAQEFEMEWAALFAFYVKQYNVVVECPALPDIGKCLSQGVLGSRFDKMTFYMSSTLVQFSQDQLDGKYVAFRCRESLTAGSKKWANTNHEGFPNE